MAMTKCRECQTVVSTEAKACPKCGAEKPGGQPSRLSAYLWLGTVLTLVLVLIASGTRGDAPRAASARSGPSEVDIAGRAIGAARALRSTMRNPDSFSVISARLVGSDLVCFQYRAQNGFGGMNVEQAAVWGSTTLAGKAFTAEWQTQCRGAGVDVSHYVN